MPLQRLQVFSSAHDGYGDAKRASGSNTGQMYVEPRRLRRTHSYNRAFGSMDARWPGELRLGAQIVATYYAGYYTFGALSVYSPLGAVEWEDVNTVPLILVSGDDQTQVIKDATATADRTHTAGFVVTDGVMHDDGAGVPYYYVASGGLAGSAKIERRNRAGAWTVMTNLRAYKMLSIGNDLYLSVGVGSSPRASGVAKIAAGTSIVVGLAQPTGTTVGRADQVINNLVAHKRSPIALKPEGIFGYDRATDTWVNHALGSGWQIHPDNGLAYWYEEGDLCVAMGMGGAVRFDGNMITEYDLLPRGLTTPNVDTTTQIIAAAGTARHYGLLATKIGGKSAINGGTAGISLALNSVIAVSTDNGATYSSNYAAAMLDSTASSTMPLSGLVGAAGATKGYLLIGRREPFAGVRLQIDAGFNTATAQLTAEIWTGAAWTPITMFDGTSATNPGDISLSRSGWMFFAADPIAAGWQRNVVATAVPVYHMRLSWDFTLSSPTTPSGISFAPWRPGIDASAASSSADFTQDGLDRAGAFPHILMSYTDDIGRHVTHDMGNLVGVYSGGDDIGKVLYARIGGNNENDSRMPVFLGRSAFHRLRVGQDDRPAIVEWPMIHTTSLIEFPFVDLTEEFPAQPGQPQVEAYRLRHISIDGSNWHLNNTTTITGYLWMRFDDGTPWQRLCSFDALPLEMDVNDGRFGKSVQFAFGALSGVSSVVGAPTIDYIHADFEPVSDKARRLPRQSPPVV